MHLPADQTGKEEAAAGDAGDPGKDPRKDQPEPADPIYSRLSLAFGVLTAIIGTLSLVGDHSRVIPFGSLFFSYFSIAVSTALIWTFFGAVLAYLAVWPHPGRNRYIIIAGIAIISIVEALEIPLNIMGEPFIDSPLILPVSSAAMQPETAPYFPVAPLLIIIAAVALLLLVKADGGTTPEQQRTRDLPGIAGGFIAVVSLLFILGYFYQMPFLIGTPFIPVGITSALAGFCTGAGLVAAAGPLAFPLRYFTGTSVRSQILRTIIPLVFVFFLLDNILDLMVSPYLHIQGPALFSLTAVIFSLVDSLAFIHVSKGLSAQLEAEERRRKRSEEALREANKKLNLLNSITRHDILNQLMVIDGYLEIFGEECHGDEKLKTYFEKVIRSTKMIEHQITFTKYYQELGVQEPVWHRVQAVGERVSQMHGFEKVKFTIGTDLLEVYADPLFEKVFFNLFDNAVRHGEHVTMIRIRSEQKDGNLILIVEDDGIGISNEDKPKIFRRGYGKHTGFGLFLTREILDITGITIHETGRPGTGARFEITVPAGKFRFAPAS
jgi:signal transduction histidine kinase